MSAKPGEGGSGVMTIARQERDDCKTCVRALTGAFLDVYRLVTTGLQVEERGVDASLRQEVLMHS